MNRAGSLKLFRLGLIALLAVLCARTAESAVGHEISAFYKVTEATDLGQEVRVSLQIRFVNNSDADLRVSKCALRSVWPGTREAEAEMPLLLRAHQGALVTQQFLVARMEFEQWEKGTRPRLFVRLRTTDGNELTRIILLSPGQAAPMGVE